MEIKDFSIAAYDDALKLWQRCEGIGLSSADERDEIRAFLQRNPGMSFLAYDGGELVGTILAGHDGRRGFLYHLAVDPRYRHHGLGKRLSELSLDKLQQAGIQKCHIMVFEGNKTGLVFWESIGWIKRPEIVLLSREIGGPKKKSGE